MKLNPKKTYVVYDNENDRLIIIRKEKTGVIWATSFAEFYFRKCDFVVESGLTLIGAL